MMIAAFIITIIGCIVWWWLIQQSLQFYRLRQSTVWVLIGLSMCSVLAIIGFPHVYHSITGQRRTQPLTTQSAFLYIIYIALVSLAVSLVVFYRAGRGVLLGQMIALLVVSVVGVLFPKIGLYSVYYYLLAAGVEEYIKYYVGLGSWKLYGIVSSDFVLFAMMSGLGFACIENVVYLLSSGESGAIVTSITRLVVGPLVHMVCSGLLAYGWVWLRTYGFNYSALIVSVLGVVLIHTGYNAYISTGGWLMLVGICVLGYGIVSYLLYQCDRLYFVAVQEGGTSAGK